MHKMNKSHRRAQGIQEEKADRETKPRTDVGTETSNLCTILKTY